VSNTHFVNIIKWLKEPEQKDIHKFYSLEGKWCYLSDCDGNRYKLSEYDTIVDAQRFVSIIRHKAGVLR
jgi:hypothetical protein